MTDEGFGALRIAAIVPCHNEEAAVGRVVTDLRRAVPTMDVFVYDNCSTDRTREVAEGAGAEVRVEERPGKGHVIRRALADIDADVYVMIDGDDTYDAYALPEMLTTLLDGPFDQVIGVRIAAEKSAFRSGHQARQPHVQPSRVSHLRATGHRHAQWLPRLLASLRQVLPGDVTCLRDRNRA